MTSLSSFPCQSAPKLRVQPENEVLPFWSGPALPAIYGQLVRKWGGVDAAAVFLGVAKSTVSNQIAGTAAIGPQHFGPLEDALGRWPITDLLASRGARQAGVGDLVAMVRAASSEVADLGAVFLDLVTQGEGDLDVRARAVKELSEALAVLAQIRDRMEEGGAQ